MSQKIIRNVILFEVVERAKKKSQDWQWPEAVRRSVEEMQNERIIPAGVRHRVAYFSATLRIIEKEQREAKEASRERQIEDSRRVALLRRDHLLPKEDQEPEEGKEKPITMEELSKR